MLPRVLSALHGRVLVAHHAAIEVEFLARATQATYDGRPPLTAVDTMRLQHRLQVDEHGEVNGSLRLDAARAVFGLPRYAAHHALTDAIAAGELFLAQMAELERRLGREALLRDLSPKRSDQSAPTEDVPTSPAAQDPCRKGLCTTTMRAPTGSDMT